MDNWTMMLDIYFYFWSLSLTSVHSSHSLWCSLSGTGAFPMNTPTGSKEGMSSLINGYRYCTHESLMIWHKKYNEYTWSSDENKQIIKCDLLSLGFDLFLDCQRLRRPNMKSCKQWGSTSIHASPRSPASCCRTLDWRLPPTRHFRDNLAVKPPQFPCCRTVFRLSGRMCNTLSLVLFLCSLSQMWHQTSKSSFRVWFPNCCIRTVWLRKK